MKKIIFFTLVAMPFSFAAKASHNNGGEITYEWVSGNTYKVKLVLYVDCSSLMPDTIAYFSSSVSCAVSRFDSLPYSYKEDASQVCDTMQTSCNGGPVGGQTKWVYEGNVTYTPCNDWTLNYTQCCRSSAPMNIVSPNSKNFYIETIFDNTTIQNNNSPYFADNPRWLIPVNGSNLINAGAYDQDGDSLYFSFVASKEGPGANMPYNVGYSFNQPFGASSTSINSQTGIISTLAQNVGQFVVTVRVDEFRDGQFLSSVNRDFVTNVYTGSNALPELTNSNLNFDLCTIDTLNVDLHSSDATDTITTSILAHPYNSLGFTYSSPTSLLTDTNTLEWDLYGFGAQPDKDYIIYINVEDEICPVKNIQSYAVVVSSSYCVWPGDANNDLIADVFDVLPIGVYYGNTGSTRAGATTNWEGQWSQNWGPKQVTGDDIKHADCNGDGIIDGNDTTAILLNYNLTHLKSGGLELSGVNDPDLYIDINPDTIGTSTPLSIPVMLGTPSQPADSVYGVVLRLSYDPTKIDSIAGVTVDYSNSWLGTQGVDMIAIDTNFYNNGQVDIGIVRTDGQMVSNGFGEILTLNIITIDNLSGKTTSFGSLIVDFIDSKIIDINEMDRPHNQQLDSVVIKDITSGVGELGNTNVVLAPNPTTGKLMITAENMIESIEVYNTVGQQIAINSVQTGKSRIIDLTGYDKGIYLVKVIYENQSFTIRKVLLH